MQDLRKQKIFKNFAAVETKVADGTPRTLVVKISTPTPDRSKDTVQPSGMVADNFLKNPVVMFAHNYADMPIAKCSGLKVQDTGILATVQFPDEGVYEKADTIYTMYKEGFLNAWSIGFMPLDYDENEQGGYNFKSWELFEFSSVPVPDNPEALTVMRSKGINVDVLLEKGVLPFHDTPKAPEDEPWDAGEEVKAASAEDLKEMCAWYDESKPDDKTSYKLPHHKAEGDHAVVWKGVAAAMGALLGARGGVDIPDTDRKGVYDHLAKHYKQFDKDVPDFKEADESEEETVDDETEPYTDDTKITDLTVGDLKDIFEDVLESGDDDEQKGTKEVIGKDVNEVVALSYMLDELHYFIRAFQQSGVSQESIDKLQQALALIMDVTREQAELGKKSIDFKTGRTISAKHEGLLQDACDYMDKAAEQVKTVLSSVVSDEQSDNDEKDDGKSATTSGAFFQKLANSLKTNNQKQDLTLRLLKTIMSEKEKGGEKNE